MARFLIDTNILVRLANIADVQHAIAANAVVELHRRGELLHVTPQVLIEFRNVATRPTSANGLGLSVADAEAQANGFEGKFSLLEDTPDIYPAWKATVGMIGVVGKQVHDARLVAVCHSHGITHFLTFNVPHFARFAGCGPGLTVVDPATI